MTRTCPICGEDFTPNPARPAQQFCSRKCKTLANVRAHRLRKRAGVPPRARTRKRADLSPRKCPTCGKTFTPHPKYPHARYCSRTCAARGCAAAVQAPPRVCPWCGKEFIPHAYAQVYCSSSCGYGAKRNREKARPIRKVGRAVPGEPLASLARVRAYLALPPAERYARRGELTKAEHALAQKIYMENHSIRTVETNDLMH
ncbi:MAG: hypothetical protein IIZ06_02085 [Kiritimatiellae bacterium]|nr:hypothetical protein [Kiritimatiellia bacterium]